MRLRLLALLAVFALALAACSMSLSRTDGRGQAEGVEPGAELTLEQSTAPIESSGVAEVVRKSLPSVVNVKVVGLGESFGGDESRAQGSGVIVDGAGYIVTNNHVIEGAAEVEVVFTDKSLDDRRTQGRVIGTDPAKDLAVIKVDVDGLRAIELGSEDSLRLGDEVIALGFPLGLGGATVTAGIVSAKERDISVGGGAGLGEEQLQGVLQTDAAINPGNSGGALVDTAGRLVGINTAAAAASSAENVGFAISIDTALPIIVDIIENPAERRAWLGVNISDPNDPRVEEVFEDVADRTEGAGLVEVFPNGPAHDADLEAGEVIVAIEGDEIASPEDLTDVLADYDPGDEVTLTLVGPDGEREVEVELEERPVTLGG
ncbi:MAG TPA: trypsin-like peptidase domain-containing protein [Actinomycetota bacterium]|nr:trypsin-like peptidase domain-containing protein [Actinomycetota bacterium]